ncbi:MAG: type III pantothenate kinase [Candidatus Omnitrophica bacterium]|nr:type III pantothenate kinase [Candidatus Omnitrophota bacterium]
MKLLAIDIGNTSAHFIQFTNGRFQRPLRIATSRLVSAGLWKILKKRYAFSEIRAVAIASVVPVAGRFLKRELSRRFGRPVYLIGKDFPVPISNRYKNPRQVGVDRLLNALAAHRRFKKECIVVDFGTAITFDVVSKKGEYLGGVIAPGIEISLEALFQKTALLPRTRLKHPRNAIGKDTAESIRVGCSVGIGGLCDRVIETISRRHRLRPAIIATGGYAAFMSRYCEKIGAIDPLLIMRGIVLSFAEKNSLTKK